MFWEQKHWQCYYHYPCRLAWKIGLFVVDSPLTLNSRIEQNQAGPHSKRFLFIVAPMIWIPNQLIGAAVGNNVTLECITEAMPKAIAYWVFNGTMVMTAGRFRTHEHHHSNYKLDLKYRYSAVWNVDTTEIGHTDNI